MIRATITAMLLIPSPSWTRDWVIRDQQGRRTGTIEPQSDGRYVHRDGDGRRTGTVERNDDGSWTMKDTLERRAERAEQR